MPEKVTELRFVSATQLLVAASWIVGQSLKLLSVSCQVVGAQTFSTLHLQALFPLPTILCGLDKVSLALVGFAEQRIVVTVWVMGLEDPDSNLGYICTTRQSAWPIILEWKYCYNPHLKK